MNKRIFAPSLALLLCALLAAPAFAWGPQAQKVIVNTALQLVSREQNLALNRLQSDIQAGVALSPPALEALYPDLIADPLRAIENEMALLTAARGAKIDSYYAFRLGALGKMVSQYVSPMYTSEPNQRSQYYNDAEGSVNAGSLKPAPRKIFETMQALERVMREANANNDLIENDYKTGRGFRASAHARLADDLSRSINTVADIWWTVVSSRAVQGNISQRQLQEYIFHAYSYYVDQESAAALENAEKNYEKLVDFSPDLRVKLGDLFFQAGMMERSVREYEIALEGAPEKREIVEKIGAYYSDRAEQSLEKGLLEEALAGFEKALQVHGLHPTAERSRLEVEAMIRKRDALHAQYQETLAQADDLRSLAAEEARRTRYAEAIALLQQCQTALSDVGDEFPLEMQHRIRAERDNRTRIAELRQLLLSNTASFSGSAFGPDIKVLVQDASQGLEHEALRSFIDLSYLKEMVRLKGAMQTAVSLEQP